MRSNAGTCATPGHDIPAYMLCCSVVGPKVIVPLPSLLSVNVTSLSVDRLNDFVERPLTMITRAEVRP